MATLYLNASNDLTYLNRAVELANSGNTAVSDGTLSGSHQKNLINPEVFYSKQLLDTIRLDADQYVYYRLADEMPIQEKADKLTVRRWAPLQAHTIPLAEGVPPVSDKGSVEKYEIQAFQYGRYMEFTDKVDFGVVDPVVAHYTREYSLVAMETLDMLARETLFASAQKAYAGTYTSIQALAKAYLSESTKASTKPSLNDLRLIVLSMKKALVKPRSNGRYHVIGSPEFFFDMISDPIVEKYMTINQTTKTMYDNSQLVPMFEMEFYETMCVPTHGQYMDGGTPKLATRTSSGSFSGVAMGEPVSGYVKDSRTGKDASYIPNQVMWNIAPDSQEIKVQHILVVGKDALVRTGLAGEGNAKMYVKQKGSAGVLDPIDQRQSIGFKINSVGFGTTRSEAIVDYACIPSQVNAF